MNKKKILILISVILLVLGIGIILIVANLDSEDVPKDNEIITPNIEAETRLDEYIKDLTDHYCIKYSGKFKDNSGELVESIIEFTKDGNNYGIRSTEIGMQIICEGDKLYSVSNEYKLIIEMARESFNIAEYNLVSNIGQTFVKTYKENINSLMCDVEEYTYNGKTIKYYFKDKEIKLIKYDNQDIRIIRVEKNTNTELLVKPNGYSYAIA